VGISNYPADKAAEAARMLRQLGTPCLIHQPAYSMFNRWVEDGLIQTLKEEGVGCIAFSPLAQGLLTDRYLNGIPEGSRASKEHGFLKPAHVTDDKIEKVKKLNALVQKRGQTLAQMALAWVLRHDTMTSVLIGACKVSQIEDAVGTLNNLDFSAQELTEIEKILKDWLT
jgi:L-glyceraldehyde 3-phosphate reductase